MKKLLSILLSLVITASTLSLPVTSFADENRVSIHDPSITLAENGKYYIVGSHLVMGESSDLINWNDMGYRIDGDNYLCIDGMDWKENLAEPLKWTTSYQQTDVDKYGENSRYYGKELEYNCWANDIIYNSTMGCYCLYGSCSVWGTTASVIWLATSENIEGPYRYRKSFIYSGITDITQKNKKDYLGLYYGDSNIPQDLVATGLMTDDEISEMPWFTGRGFYDCGLGKYPNCIDPTAFTDKNGDMWLVYGSYSGGCYVIKLKNETGTPDYEYMKKTKGFDIYFGKQISCTNEGSGGTGEGPYIIYDKQTDYYYFFLTYGGLDAKGGYNIREYRSRTPYGPYYDSAGNKATDNKNTGLKLAGNYKFDCNSNAYLSPGHSSCLIDKDGSMYQAYHVRFDGRWSDNTEGHEVRIHKMARTQDGWSVMLPFEYNGESDVNSVTVQEVAGVYEFINSTDQSQSVADWWYSPNDDIILPTQLIYLNPNGKVEGVRDYMYDYHHTNLGYTYVSGTWSLVNGTAYADFKIGKSAYKVVFAKQKDESAEKNEKIVFAGKGDNNTTIWGAKDNDHSVADVDIHKKHNSAFAFVTRATLSKNGKIETKCSACGETVSTKYIYIPKTFTLSATSYTYDGKEKKPAVTVKDSKGNKIASSYYSLKYSNNKAVGKASVKITFKGNYSGSKTLSFTINPKGTKISSLTASSKSFTAKWKKQATQTTGYEIQYSTDKNFKKGNKTVAVSKNSTTSKKVSKLSAKKKYYVRIRTYKTVSGKKYYSSWSGAKSVKTK